MVIQICTWLQLVFTIQRSYCVLFLKIFMQTFSKNSSQIKIECLEGNIFKIIKIDLYKCCLKLQSTCLLSQHRKV